jgi:sulfur-carrier protein
MTVTVKLFAIAAELAKAPTIEIGLEDGSTVADLRQAMAQKCPALARVLPHFLFAVNSQYATETTVIPAAADVACIPPVSGG